MLCMTKLDSSFENFTIVNFPDHRRVHKVTWGGMYDLVG